MKLNYSEIQELREMYFKATKHAFYQPVPVALSEFFIDLKLDKKWRDVTPRLNLIKRNLQSSNFSGTIVEIGSNTGFQILDLAESFPGNKFIAIESNTDHASFISKCATILEIENVEVVNSTSSPRQISINWPDSILLDFNVVHHSGFDFGPSQSRNIKRWWATDLPEWFNFENSFRDYWFSCGFRLGGQHNFDLFDPFDTAGFTRNIMEVSGLKKSYDISIYSIDSQGEELIYSQFIDSSLENLNLVISRTFRELSLNGEYFRRPILRFTKKV